MCRQVCDLLTIELKANDSAKAKDLDGLRKAIEEERHALYIYTQGVDH